MAHKHKVEELEATIERLLAENAELREELEEESFYAREQRALHVEAHSKLAEVREAELATQRRAVDNAMVRRKELEQCESHAMALKALLALDELLGREL